MLATSSPLNHTLPTAPSLCGGSAGSIPTRFCGERRARKQLFCEPSGRPKNLRKLRVRHVRLTRSGQGFGHVGTMDGEDCPVLGLTCGGPHRAYRHRTRPHSCVESTHRPRRSAGRSDVRRRPRTHAHGYQLGPDVDFRLLRVKFLETISSPRRSNFQGNFREMQKKVRY